MCSLERHTIEKRMNKRKQDDHHHQLTSGCVSASVFHKYIEQENTNLVDRRRADDD
jgi:hypothetical protein